MAGEQRMDGASGGDLGKEQESEDTGHPRC